jgi:hypothetical protein
MSKTTLVILTLLVWLVGTVIYAYLYVTSVLADPSTAGYERSRALILFGFIVYRGIYLFVGIVVLICVELMLFETLFRKSLESTRVE